MARLYQITYGCICIWCRMQFHIKRHKKRFPEDFMFQLSKSEYDFLISQFVTSKKSGRGGVRKMPHAFTEQGVAMLSGILNSDRAIYQKNNRDW